MVDFILCKSQSNVVHLLLEPDSLTQCDIMRNGKFLNFNYEEKDYIMITDDSTVTEYLEGGKKIIKSSRVWKNNCSYKLTIVENTSDVKISIGDSIFVEIVSTQQEKVKLRTLYKGDTINGLYVKISDNINLNVANTPEDIMGKNAYQNPADGKTYLTQGDFIGYKNGEEVDSTNGIDTVNGLSQVVFLSSDNEIRESIETDDLKKIILKSEEIFYKNFNNSKGDGKILVQFSLSKRKKTQIVYAIKDDIDLEKMKQFEIDMNNEKFIRSNKHNIVFQLIFNIKK